MTWWLMVLAGCGGECTDGDCTGDEPVTPVDTSTASDTASSPSDTGTAGRVTDEVLQNVAEVDVLYVIDDSPSMADNQSELVDAVPVLIDFFLGTGLDFHVGVVTTTVDLGADGGRLVEVDGARWIDRSTSSPLGTFVEMASVGIAGSSTPQGLEAIRLALDELAATDNAGFLRATSDVHVVVVSDGDDESPNLDVPSFTDWWTTTIAAGRSTTTFSAIIHTSGPESGFSYFQLANDLGGVVWDIEDAGYGEVLEQIGARDQVLEQSFCLSEEPDAATLEVSVQDGGTTQAFDLDVDYTWDSATNCVTFLDYVPPSGSTVVLSYLPL